MPEESMVKTFTALPIMAAMHFGAKALYGGERIDIPEPFRVANVDKFIQPTSVGYRLYSEEALDGFTQRLFISFSAELTPQSKTKLMADLLGWTAEKVAKRYSEEELKDSSVDLSRMLPPIMRRAGEYFCFGTNCFNIASRATGSGGYLPHTTPAGMAFRLKHFYRFVSPLEPLRFGDVIAVWGYEMSNTKKIFLLHTTVYLGSGIVFEKEDYDSTTSIDFAKLDSRLGPYEAHNKDVFNDDGRRVFFTIHR